MRPILSSGLLIPNEYKKQTATARRKLTFELVEAGGQVALDEEGNAKLVKAFRKTPEGLLVPRQYGLSQFTDFEDKTSAGYELADNLKPIDLWPAQQPWVDSIVANAATMYDMVAKAHTGFGKTISAVEVARRLGSTTLIVVDQENLMDQWMEAITDKKFLGASMDQVGVIQGQRCEYYGADFVIAMIQSLYNKELTEDVYRYFGTVIFDEAHTAGAPQFSKVLLQFPAQFRIGISATPNRPDVLQKVLKHNIGKVEVEAHEQHRKSTVRVVESPGVYSWYANISPKTGRFITEVSADARRNQSLCGVVLDLYKQGRNILVIGERLVHLQELMAGCAYLGIPDEVMGLIGGYYHRWGYAKDPSPPRLPEGLAKTEGDARKYVEYTPVKMQLIKRKMSKKEMDRVKHDCQIIFSTYAKFAKGVDVPRLDSGVDCTPRAKAEQVHGRILRKREGKLVPIWVTFRDIWSFRSEFQFASRLTDYLKSNAEVKLWKPGVGVKKADPKKLIREARGRAEELKEAEIKTNIDGSYIIVTPGTGRR